MKLCPILILSINCADKFTTNIKLVQCASVERMGMREGAGKFKVKRQCFGTSVTHPVKIKLGIME